MTTPYVDPFSIAAYLLTMLALDVAGFKIKRGGGVFYIAAMTLGMYMIGMIFDTGSIIMNAGLVQVSSTYALNSVDPNVITILMVVATLASAYLIYWDYFVDSP